jgi:TRAP-type C4-dicarboxylate transport system permease small subunit
MKRFETNLTKALEGIIAVFLGLIVVMVVTLVGLRYLFNSSITGANELIVILFVYTTAIGAVLGIAKGDHLALVFVIEKLPPKGRWLAEVTRIGLVGLINLVALVYSIQWMQVTGNYLMPSTGLPRWVAQLSIPMGCLLGMCYIAMHLVRLSRTREIQPDNQTVDTVD